MTKGVIFHAHSEMLSIFGDPVAWTNTIEKLGFDFYIMIDKEAIVPDWVETKSIQGYRVDDMADALQLLSDRRPECSLVELREDAVTTVTDWTPPEDICWIVGPDVGADPVLPTAQKISLPCGRLWAIQAITAVWGRYM